MNWESKRRLARPAFTFFSMMSLLLCVAICVLWLSEFEFCPTTSCTLATACSISVAGLQRHEHRSREPKSVQSAGTITAKYWSAHPAKAGILLYYLTTFHLRKDLTSAARPTLCRFRTQLAAVSKTNPAGPMPHLRLPATRHSRTVPGVRDDGRGDIVKQDPVALKCAGGDSRRREITLPSRPDFATPLGCSQHRDGQFALP